jgi:membrane fusion protein (multidrug efflux system)
MFAGLLLAAAAACDRPGGETASASGAGEKALHVRAVKPSRREVVRRVLLPATVRADMEVTLYNKVAGYVKTIIKDRGDRVKTGELIAKIEIPEMALELENARASFALEDSTLRRLEAIRKIEKAAVTDQDMDLARAKRAMAEATMKRLETMLGYTEIRAPFDGYITERFVDPGAFIKEGRIVHIEDTTTVRVLVDVPEPEVRFAEVGTTAVVHLDAFPGMEIQGKITRRAPGLDLATRTMIAEIELANPERKILPGMFARVELAVERRKEVLALPGKAIVIHQDKAFVFVQADGTAQKVAVALGTVDGPWTEVTQGLKGDESILLSDGQPLVDAMPIQIVEGKNE